MMDNARGARARAAASLPLQRWIHAAGAESFDTDADADEMAIAEGNPKSVCSAVSSRRFQSRSDNDGDVGDVGMRYKWNNGVDDDRAMGHGHGHVGGHGDRTRTDVMRLDRECDNGNGDQQQMQVAKHLMESTAGVAGDVAALFLGDRRPTQDEQDLLANVLDEISELQYQLCSYVV